MAEGRVIVVGAGLAGLEVAWELHRRGVEGVLVVDSATGTRAPGSGWTSARPPHYLGTGQWSERIGGRSLRWHGVVLRLEPWALADTRWPRSAVEALCSADPHGLYDRVEEDMETWTGRPLAVGTEADQALVDRLLSAGFVGAMPVPHAVRDGVAYSALHHWDSAASPPRIEGGWSAVELVSGRTPGVRLRSTETRDERIVGADAVVLAAGALESARLVLQGTSRTGILDSGLNDHLVQGFLALVSPDALGLPAADAFALVPGTPGARSNLFVRVRPAPGGSDLALLDVWEMGEQLPEGQTTLTTEGGEAPWRIRVHPELSGRDRDVLAGQSERLRAAWAGVAALPGHPVFPDLLTHPVGFDAARDRVLAGAGPQVYAWPLGSVQHEGGSLPLGGDLVDDEGRVRAAPAVHVTGPALFPRPGAANPSLTTLALARRTAARLAG